MHFCPTCKGIFPSDVEVCPTDGERLMEVGEVGNEPLSEREQLQRLQMVENPTGRFTVISKIGQGGWGGVYRAYQHSTKRIVALKVLRPEIGQDQEARRRFHREAEAVSKLTHPHIVTLYDFGETPDHMLFMAMEYVEGKTLDQVVKDDGPLPPLRAVAIARQVALALADAHAKGVIHRDVKPFNVMLTQIGGQGDFVKVLDFGVAKLVDQQSSLTSTGTTFGTPEYMSPEQVQGKDLDERTDLYSLGVILYEMLAGKPPFGGGSAVTVALQQVQKRPPPIAAAQGVPPELGMFLKRLLAKNRKDRPANAREVANELKRLDAVLSASETVAPGGKTVSTAVSFGTTVSWPLVVAAGCALVALAVVTAAVTGRLGAIGDREVVAAVEGEAVAEAEAPQPGQEGRDAAPGAEAPAYGKAAAAPQPAAVAPAAVAAGPQPVVWTLPDLSFVERLPAAWRRAVASQPSHSERAEGAGTAAGSGPVGAGRKGTAAGGGQENGKGTSGTPAGTGEGAVMPAVQEVAISFSSNVDKATVVVGGVAACITPCRVTRKVGESAEVRVEKEGFAAYARTLTWERAVGVHAVLSEVLSKTDGLKDGSTTATDDGLK